MNKVIRYLPRGSLAGAACGLIGCYAYGNPNVVVVSAVASLIGCGAGEMASAPVGALWGALASVLYHFAIWLTLALFGGRRVSWRLVDDAALPEVVTWFLIMTYSAALFGSMIVQGRRHQQAASRQEGA